LTLAHGSKSLSGSRCTAPHAVHAGALIWHRRQRWTLVPQLSLPSCGAHVEATTQPEQQALPQSLHITAVLT